MSLHQATLGYPSANAEETREGVCSAHAQEVSSRSAEMNGAVAQPVKPGLYSTITLPFVFRVRRWVRQGKRALPNDGVESGGADDLREIHEFIFEQRGSQSS
jgi:hypothetical protein